MDNEKKQLILDLTNEVTESIIEKLDQFDKEKKLNNYTIGDVLNLVFSSGLSAIFNAKLFITRSNETAQKEIEELFKTLMFFLQKNEIAAGSYEKISQKGTLQ